MDPKDAYTRLESAHKLLKESSTSREKFESVRTLIKGMNPTCDKLLSECSTALTRIDKLKQGEVIEVTAELLPEETEKEKKRKKSILLFIRSWKQLHDEVHRLKTELSDIQTKDMSGGEKVLRTGKILTTAKGPLGIITLAALAIAAVLLWTNEPTPAAPPELKSAEEETAGQTIEVIDFNGKQISLAELSVRTGPDCVNGPREIPHYHAGVNSQVQTTDGTVLQDPGGCAFGRVADTVVRTIPGPIR